MKSFTEIETAAKNLPPAEREKLVRSLSPKARSARSHARPIQIGPDCLLQAPQGAPLMTPERVRQLLDESP
ncbi:MAG: hypothetical protein ACRCXD_15210 [Luteolibacter sp.]